MKLKVIDRIDDKVYLVDEKELNDFLWEMFPAEPGDDNYNETKWAIETLDFYRDSYNPEKVEAEYYFGITII